MDLSITCWKKIKMNYKDKERKMHELYGERWIIKRKKEKWMNYKEKERKMDEL